MFLYFSYQRIENAEESDSTPKYLFLQGKRYSYLEEINGVSFYAYNVFFVKPKCEIQKRILSKINLILFKTIRLPCSLCPSNALRFTMLPT